ncbi:MAG: tetratricopeptide repeat protein [Spirochaeta sp.]
MNTYSQDFFERGEDAFLHDNPDDATALLEIAVQNDPENAQAYIYLGIAYAQIGYLERAADALRRGTENAGEKLDQLYHNLAIVYQKMDDVEAAEDAYQRAVQYNPSYSPSYLNRGNLNVRQEEYDAAIQDYRVYLNLQPQGDQAENVRRMITALQDEIVEQQAEAERQRIAQEEAERQAEREEEERRIREEEERQAAAERRRQLLGSVLDSLEDSGREADPLGATSEDFEDFDFELGRED